MPSSEEEEEEEEEAAIRTEWTVITPLSVPMAKKYSSKPALPFAGAAIKSTAVTASESLIVAALVHCDPSFVADFHIFAYYRTLTIS